MRKFYLILILSIPLIFLLHTKIFASSGYNSYLTITPPLKIININPNSSYKSFIEVLNRSQENKKVYLSVDSFREKGDTSSPLFSQKINNLSQAIHWIKISKTQILNGGEKTKIYFTLNIPSLASPGSHYIAISVNTINKNIIESLRSLLIINVSGKIEALGNIEKFSPTKYININPNINFQLFFQNRGNVYLAPSGFIIIRNIFGQTVKILPINKRESLTLTDATRLYQKNWQDNNFFNQFGYFSSQLIISYRYGNKVYNLNNYANFFVISPIYIIIILLLIIFAIIYIIKVVWKRKK